MDWEICFDGMLVKEPEVFQGTVGQLSFEYVQGHVRHVRWRGIEIARRIYATVRDPEWGTVPMSIVEERIEEHQGLDVDSIRVHFLAVHQHADIDYRWQGQIDAKSDGTLEFTFKGMSHSPFQANRVGLCLLHPVESLAGRDCKVTDEVGNECIVPFRNEIQPDNPGTDIASMQYELNKEESLEITFSGELFETEDQRNWIDDSFKTFCTPLSRPRPVTILEGEVREQSIRMEVHSMPDSNLPPRSVSPHLHPSNIISIELGDEIMPMRHRVGLGCGESSFRRSDFQRKQLESLHPDHVRVDVYLGNEDWRSRILEGIEFGRQVASKLELAVHLEAAQIDSLGLLAEILGQNATRVCRCCVYSSASLTSSDELNRRVIPALRSRLPDLPIYAGTMANFAELNRQRPSLPELSGLCFAAQPQEHAFDNASLIETPRALGQAVSSARQFAPRKSVCVGPITLRRQFNPFGQRISECYGQSLPATVDPRQMSLLGAAWTLACLKYLSESGAVASTWYEPVGWKGIMADEHGSPLPCLFADSPKSVYPVFHVLADWCSNPLARSRSCLSSNRLQVECSAMQSQTQLQLMIVNLRTHVQFVRLPATLGEGSIRSLDQTSYSLATKDPAAFRNGVLDRQVRGDVVLELNPFSYNVLRFQ